MKAVNEVLKEYNSQAIIEAQKRFDKTKVLVEEIDGEIKPFFIDKTFFRKLHVRKYHLSFAINDTVCQKYIKTEARKLGWKASFEDRVEIDEGGGRLYKNTILVLKEIKSWIGQSKSELPNHPYR